MSLARSRLPLLATACFLVGAPACKRAPTPADESGSPDASGEKTITIGFTASQTGKYSVESTRQINGVKLWMEHVNAAGGLRLSDGTRARVAAKYYDDESSKERVQQLYATLLSTDKADFLISPYGSGLADAAAVLAEQHGKIMITAGAASDSTHAKGYSFVYQVYTPASRYLTGAFDLLAKVGGTGHRTALVHENDKFSAEVSAAAEAYAKARGFPIAFREGYEPGATDFAPFLNKFPSDVDVVMGGGHFADGSTFAKQLYEKKIAAKLVVLLVAPPEPKFAELGETALGIIGPSQWEPKTRYSEGVGRDAGVTFLGPTADAFVAAYRARFGGEEPAYHAAGGYVAGLLLQRAVVEKGSTDSKVVREAMDTTDVMTFFGRQRFDTTSSMHGLQRGHEMVYVQWQRGDNGKLTKEVIWPDSVKSKDAVYPIRP